MPSPVKSADVVGPSTALLSLLRVGVDNVYVAAVARSTGSGTVLLYWSRSTGKMAEFKNLYPGCQYACCFRAINFNGWHFVTRSCYPISANQISSTGIGDCSRYSNHVRTCETYQAC